MRIERWLQEGVKKSLVPKAGAINRDSPRPGRGRDERPRPGEINLDVAASFGERHFHPHLGPCAWLARKQVSVRVPT